jgi:flagellar biosynthesis protein
MAEEKEKAKAKPAANRRTAVAMRYDVETDKAPLILASGRGAIADEILRVAEENKIPLYENRDLANILAKLEIDTEIPAQLYVLVAEVLFFVYKLDRMAEKREKLIKRVKEEK